MLNQLQVRSSQTPAPSVPQEKCSSRVTSPPDSQTAMAQRIEATKSAFVHEAARTPQVWWRAAKACSLGEAERSFALFRDARSGDGDVKHRARLAANEIFACAMTADEQALLKAVESTDVSPWFAQALADQEGISQKARLAHKRWRHAVNELVNQNLGLARKVAGTRSNPASEDYSERLSATYAALIRAAENYRPGATQFQTFAYSWMQKALILDPKKEAQNQPMEFDESVSHEEALNIFGSLLHNKDNQQSKPDAVWEEDGQRKMVKDVLAELDDRDRWIVSRIFGFNEHQECFSAAQIAGELKISRGRVSQIKAEVLEKIKYMMLEKM